MAIARHKVFPRPYRLKGTTLPESVKLAKGSLYEAFFDALQLSPFYKEAIQSKEFINEDVKRTYDLVGDLRNTNFETWWANYGYSIFAETKPLNQVKKLSHKNPFGRAIPLLSVDIPLDVSPQLLREQIEELLKKHHPNYKNFDRWKTSTAQIKFKSTRMTYQSISLCLKVYRKYQDKKQNQPENARLYMIGEELALNPKLNVLKHDLKAMAASKKIKMAATVTEYLDKAKNLIAHATEGNFPVVADHPWYQKKKRGTRSRYKG